MARPPSIACLLAAFSAASVAAAASGGLTEDSPAARAAIIVETFDQLDRGCLAAGGYTPSQRAQVADWQRANGVADARRVMELARQDPALAPRLLAAVDTIVKAGRAQRQGDCAAATVLTRMELARFGPITVPGDTATSPGVASPATAPAPAAAPPAPLRDPARTSAVPESIDSFGFATRPKMGIGGFIALDIYPVVLFRNGDALTNVALLDRPPGGKDWTRWRRDGGRLQLLQEGQWKDLPFQTTYDRLPDGLRLDGLFRSLGGTGNVAAGGSQSVTVVDEYRFSPDGSVMRTGVVGSTGAAGDTSVATRGGPGTRPGRYRIDGLTLHVDYADGTREQRFLIADPKDPNGGIWLDGVAYPRRRGSR